MWTIFQKWQTKNHRIRKVEAHKKRQYPIADIFLLSNGLATRYYSKTVILPLCYTCQNYPRGNCIFLWWSIDSSDSAYWAVQENINAIRAAAGLSPLAMDGGMSAAADARCECFVAGGAFDHSGMTTRSEICAAGPIGSASSVCSYWQNSPAHYANITNASFTSMGVACWFCSTAEGQYTYWTVTFN